MTFDELIEICQPLNVYGTEPEHFGPLTQDSREVSEGSVFIAVRGTQVDGHIFIENAISRGASVIICEDVYYTDDPNVCVIEVENTRTLIGSLAQAFQGNPARQLTLIGITGTNGKTTVANLVHFALSRLGARPSILGTVGKRIQDEVLESLLTTEDPVELARDMRKMVDANSTHLVMEVSSHALDQERVAGIDFEIAAFTNLSHDHLDYHESLDDYAAAKKKLFDNLPASSTAVINGDDPNGQLMLQNCKAKPLIFSFEDNKIAEIHCQLIESSSGGIRIAIDELEFRSPLVGRFNAFNVASAFLICKALGFEEDAIGDALSQATGAGGRLERVQLENTNQQPLVLVDYAHTPDALENVLSTLNDLKDSNQKLHVIFGCGGDRDKAKRPQMARVAQQYADRITVTSDNPRSEDPTAIIDDIMAGFSEPTHLQKIANRRQAIEHVITESEVDNIILIAGKGHETYQEIAGERHDFDDREVARKALSQRTGTQNLREAD